MIDRADLRTIAQGILVLVALALSSIAIAGILGLAVQMFRLASGL
jgi:hypothetical protein